MIELLIPEDRRLPVHESLCVLQKLITKPGFSSESHMLREGETKFLVHHFPESFTKKHDTLEILALSDVQFGHKCCRIDKLIEYRDWFLEEPNRFCVWVGDMIDSWRVGSPGSGYDNWFRPDAQLYKWCETMAPIVSRCLGYVGGNHERRGLAGGVDLGSLIAWSLGIPYSSGEQMVSVFYGSHQPFKIHLWHGAGAAATAGGRVNMALKKVPNDEAHAFISGHNHWPFLYPGWHVRRNHGAGRIESEAYFVMSASSFMDFWGSYAEVSGATFADLMMPKITLHKKGTFDAIFRAKNQSAE